MHSSVQGIGVGMKVKEPDIVEMGGGEGGGGN
jgi:hypothetical protein